MKPAPSLFVRVLCYGFFLSFFVPHFAYAQTATLHCQFRCQGQAATVQGPTCTTAGSDPACTSARCDTLCGGSGTCEISSIICVQDAPRAPGAATNANTNTAAAGRRGYGLIDPLGNVSLQTVIARIIRFALGFVGALLLVMFIYGGFLWMTAGGEGKRVDQAKTTIRNAIMGLLVVGLSYTLINLLFGVANIVLGS